MYLAGGICLPSSLRSPSRSLGVFPVRESYCPLTSEACTLGPIFPFFGINLLFAKAIVVVRSLSHIQLFVTPWTTAHQASLSSIISWSLLKFMSIESVMLSNHLILFCPLLLLPSIFPSIRIFSNESVLCIRWPKYCSFSFSISPSNEYSGLISFRID